MAGLYIHVPFCHSKCAYCDFYSMPATDLADSYIDAVISEYRSRRDEISEPFTTVYIGGGTPSILSPTQIQRLVTVLPVNGAVEFTIEANPEDINPEIIEVWHTLGINRVSMGVQSLCDDELKAIGRRHNAAEAVNAIKCILDSPIRQLSCDLIYGLPGQTLQSWLKSLSTLLKFNLPHLSAYCLSYEPGTALSARVMAGKLKPTDDDTLRDMYDTLCCLTADAGYEHYEISNFARPGKRAVHNSSYWRSVPYLGLGPGAHSFDGLNRRINPSRLRDYIAGRALTEIEDENDDERFNDVLITALRTSDGLDLSTIGESRARRLMTDASRFINAGLMTISSRRLRITEAAWFTSDSIMTDLLQ